MEVKRRLSLKTIINCRDLGGYQTPDGIIKYGRFLRCGIPETPSDADVELLRRFGVKTVIDLRGSDEAVETPNLLSRIPGAQTFNIPLFEMNVANEKDPVYMDLLESYKYVIKNYKQNILKVLNVIADAQDGAILYHCFFGKDRTGILTMFLMYIAGADRADIVADYSLTYAYIMDYIEKNRETLWSPDSVMHYSTPQTMSSLIAYIDEKYGSIGEYLTEIGVTDDALSRIKNRLLGE